MKFKVTGEKTQMLLIVLIKTIYFNTKHEITLLSCKSNDKERSELVQQRRKITGFVAHFVYIFQHKASNNIIKLEYSSKQKKLQVLLLIVLIKITYFQHKTRDKIIQLEKQRRKSKLNAIKERKPGFVVYFSD